MERTFAVKETHLGGSSNHDAKCAESPIKIDSISIDLVNSIHGTDTGKCDHFSIRGYASEIRNKDWKKCWPFALNGGTNVSEEPNCKLPPLFVPKFRWWCCEYRPQEIGAGSVNEERTVSSSSSKLKSFNTCPHVSTHGDAATWLSDLQDVGNINVGSRKLDADASLNVSSNDFHPLYSDKSDKKAEIANVPIIGQIDVENKINSEISQSNYAGIEVISGLMQQTLHIDDNVASLQLNKPDLRDNEMAGVKLPALDPKCIVKDATEPCQTGKHASMSDQKTELVKACGSNGVVSTVKRVPDAIETHTTEHPSLELDDGDCVSSESAEILLGTASGSLHRRKIRKVRLLTDLLGKEGDKKNDLTSMESSPSTAIPDESIGVDSISAPQVQVYLQGNVASSLGHVRKRKLPQDEEWIPGDMSSPNNGNKNHRTFDRGAETADGIASSDSEGTVDVTGSQAAARSHLVNVKVDKSPIIGKKKNKKIQNSDDSLSLSLSQENLQKGRKKKPGDANKTNGADNVLYKSSAVSSGSGLNPCLESARKAEKKSSLLKKKSKMHQDHDGLASPIPWNNGMLREGLPSRKDPDIRYIGLVSVPHKVTQDAPAEKGLHFSLSSCLPAKRYDGEYISPSRDGLPCLLPWQRGIICEDEPGRKDIKMNFVGQSNFQSKSEPGAYFWKGIHVDLNSNQNTYRIPFLNEKQKHSSRSEVGSCSLIQKMDYVGASKSGKAVELQEHPAVVRRHYDHQAEMASEQGASDDIPMEIVELMAKNQYERCLPDTEMDKQPSETINNTRNHQMVDLNKVYGSEEMNLFDESTQKPKPRAKNGRIGEIVGSDIAESSRQKPVDYFSHVDRNQYNITQLEQSHSPSSFRPFPLCGEKQLNGAQFSSTNSSRQNSAQNCQWMRNIVGQRSSQTSMQASGVCNTCQNAPMQNKGAHLWPSMVPSNMPYLYGIPKNCADRAANGDGLSHCPSSLPKGNMSGNDNRNFLNLASNFEKHGLKFDSELLRRTHADYSFACKHNGMGSLDLYSNDTIPAMHLLSLMDAGLQSGAPVDVDGNQRLVKKNSFLHGHHSKEFSSLPSGGYRTNSTKHPSFDCYGKNHLPESFCECMSATPTVSPSTSSLQHDKSFKKATDSVGQFSLKSGEKEKKKCSESQRQNRNRRSQKTVSSSGGLNTTCGSIPVHSMPKLALGSSDFMMFPVQFHSTESATKHKQEARTMSTTLFHSKSGSENDICSTNRNPADFTVPAAGNMYMIGGEDLKFRREAPLSSSIKLDAQKRQRKLTVRKGQSRNRTT